MKEMQCHGYQHLYSMTVPSIYFRYRCSSCVNVVRLVRLREKYCHVQVPLVAAAAINTPQCDIVCYLVAHISVGVSGKARRL